MEKMEKGVKVRDEHFFDEHGIHVTVGRSSVKDKPWSYTLNGVRRYAHRRLSETRSEAMRKGLEEAEIIYKEKAEGAL